MSSSNMSSKIIEIEIESLTKKADILDKMVFKDVDVKIYIYEYSEQSTGYGYNGFDVKSTDLKCF